MPLIRLTAILAALLPAAVHAHGFTHSENFVVSTPDNVSRATDQKLAEQVLHRAETFRREIALQWLGAELPNGAGQTSISVVLSPNEDSGLTWAKDHPDRTLHSVYLRTTAENSVGCTLHHEIVHVVLATFAPHPNRLPSWLEEGIASRYDDDTRRAAREQMRRTWVSSGQIPRLVELLENPDILSVDESAYASATSLVSFLLTKGNERTLLRFAADGQRYGWEASLRAHYRINGHAELQTQWQAWLARNVHLG
jgi:hypothetical protein